MTYRSYVGAPFSGYANETWGFAQTFMMLDIAALQHMYGADFTTQHRQHRLQLEPGQRRDPTSMATSRSIPAATGSS